jgi:hypothetical protein
MEKNLFQLEDFPNEILIEIFQNLDIHDLFRAFYNLNFRFNTLLHSLKNLSFTISNNNYSDFSLCEFPIYCISTLISTAEVHVDLERFTHIRRLILLAITFGQIQQLNTLNLPYLEHLSINFPTQSFPYTISRITNRIFSNEFPRLRSCYLPRMETIIKNNHWSQVLSLRKLDIGKINIFVYKDILTSCPNLYFLKFIKSYSAETPPPSQSHINLKRLIITAPLWCPDKQSVINIFLPYVPNLEKLIIYHAEFGASIDEYLSYDRLSLSIKNYLPLLRCFNYYLEIYYFGLTNISDIENNLNRIKEDFKKVHNDQYQSRLIIIQRF